MAEQDPSASGPDDDGPDDGPEESGEAGAAEAGAEGAPRKRRRRRRRREPGSDAAAGAPQAGPSQGQPPQQPPPQRQSQPPSQRQPQQQRQAQQPPSQRQPQQQRQAQQPPSQRQPQQQRQAQQPRDQRGREQRQGQGTRGRDAGDRGRGRDQRGRDGDHLRDQRGKENRVDPEHEADLRAGDDDVLRGDPYRAGDENEASAPHETRGDRGDRGTGAPGKADDHEDEHSTPVVAWGRDDDSPAPAVVLAPDLPVEAPAGDPDPLTYPLVDGPGAQLGDDVASVVGVRFVTAGRIQWCDAGDGDYAIGDRVMVDGDRGPRVGTVATPAARRATRDRGLRRIQRRANDHDLRGDRDGDAGQLQALRLAKDKAAALRLPLKVFRVEKSGSKLNVYYTSDEQRLDLRDFVRDVGQATGLRLELRQLGVRDEAKAVGGIGSCGLTLCCTTWLPDFVPVSIKMAKDQGLVLSPTKVSGQCGRLKCCLVYEQAGYAEMRKGLPKLGKRVISPRGEGRVVEVDVLRQRIRVSYGAGDTEVLPASEVKPMFPPGNQPRGAEPDHDGHDTEPEPDLPTS